VALDQSLDLFLEMAADALQFDNVLVDLYCPFLRRLDDLVRLDSASLMMRSASLRELALYSSYHLLGGYERIAKRRIHIIEFLQLGIGSAQLLFQGSVFP